MNKPYFDDIPVTTVFINIAEYIGTPYAIATEKAVPLYETLKKCLEEHEIVYLSFNGVKQMIGAFAHSAIGELYKDFSDCYIKDYLKLTDVQAYGPMLERIMTKAKHLYEDVSTKLCLHCNSEFQEDDYGILDNYKCNCELCLDTPQSISRLIAYYELLIEELEKTLEASS